MIGTRGADLSAASARSAPCNPLVGILEGIEIAVDIVAADLVPIVIRACSMTRNICLIPSWTPPTRIADRRTMLAEGQLGGGGTLEAQLVLDPGGDDPVALTQRAVVVDQQLRDDEQRQSLGAGTGAVGPGQHQVDDVLGAVVLAARDEPLTPSR